jgi:hypothetical protein
MMDAGISPIAPSQISDRPESFGTVARVAHSGTESGVEARPARNTSTVPLSPRMQSTATFRVEPAVAGDAAGGSELSSRGHRLIVARTVHNTPTTMSAVAIPAETPLTIVASSGAYAKAAIDAT